MPIAGGRSGANDDRSRAAGEPDRARCVPFWTDRAHATDRRGMAAEVGWGIVGGLGIRVAFVRMDRL